MQDFVQSQKWYDRASRLIPGGVNSPVRAFHHVGLSPLYFERGEGAYLYDVDGRKYVDFCLSFGPHILGHSNPEVVKSIIEQAPKSTSFGACHPGEVKLATLILSALPFLDRVRLVNSGTEAVMTAVRMARGFTGRPKILVFEGCYHGHSDGLLARAGSGVAMLSESSSQGVPASVVQETLVVKITDWAAIEKAFEENIAAVLIEPMPANHGLYVNCPVWLKRLMDLAHEHGSLVILDEVISGFRMDSGGLSRKWALNPDIVTLGKVIGGGMPLAAVVAKEKVANCLAPMGSVYQAGTLSGNPLACAAGSTVLEILEKAPPFSELAKSTRVFAEMLEQVVTPWSRKNFGLDFSVTSYGSLFWPYFGKPSLEFPTTIDKTSKMAYAQFFSLALKAGVYFPPSPFEVSFLSIAHTEEVLEECLQKLKNLL